MMFLFLNLLFVVSAHSYELKPFCTDGCSVVGNLTWNSFLCCVDHDLAYWRGGDRIDKIVGDSNFYTCLLKGDGKRVADLYTTSVALCGDKYWGVSWGNRPKFLALTSEEKEYVLLMTPKNPAKVLCNKN